MLSLVKNNHIATMDQRHVEMVRQLETEAKKLPQIKILTEHILHAGMYCRTITVPPNVVITGSLMKISTILIIQGDFVLMVNGEPKELHGYNIFTGSPNRKQAGVAISETKVTMIFPTKAKTIEEAENEFTDETHLLFSREEGALNQITITEE